MKRLILLVCFCALFSGCDNQSGSSSSPTVPTVSNSDAIDRLFNPNWHSNTEVPGSTEVNFNNILQGSLTSPTASIAAPAASSASKPAAGKGAVSDAQGGFVIEPIPDNFQETGYWCGPTSVQTVLRYWGIEMSQKEIANSPPGYPIYPGQNQGGARWDPMVTLAKNKGFSKSKIYSPDTLANLKERVRAGRPQIVSVKGTLRYPTSLNSKFGLDRTYNTGGHVMVVKGFTANGDVIVNDSAGKIGHAVMRKSDFEKVWRGNGIDFAK